MFESLLVVLGAGLQLWLSKEKTKYVDKLISLKKDYYEESNKPFDLRSDAVLDNLEFELRILGTAFAANVGKQDTPNQP
jgi:hypothetical protein